MAKNNDAVLTQLQARIEAETARYKAAVLPVIESALAVTGLTLSDLLDAKPAAKGGAPKRKAPFKGVQPAKHIETPKPALRGAAWAARQVGSRTHGTATAF